MNLRLLLALSLLATWSFGCEASDASSSNQDAPSRADAASGEALGQASGEEEALDQEQEGVRASGDAEGEARASLQPDEDPGYIGPYAVGHLEVLVEDHDDPNRRLATQVWYPASGFNPSSLTLYVVGTMGPFELEYPSEHAQREVQAADESFPFVIFSHGYGGISTQSLDLCERLASHGFVVASPAHAGNTAEDDFNGTSVSRELALADRPRDVRTLIDTFTNDDAIPELLKGRIDPSQVGVCGHSFGGYTSLSAAAGHAASGIAADARVKAIAPICPDSSEFSDAELASIQIPTLFIGGSLDESTPIEPQITRPYSLMSDAPRWRIDVTGATHTHFANICTIGAALIDMGLTPDTWEGVGAGALLEIYDETCGEDVFPIDEAIRIQTHYVVAFFRHYLRGEAHYAGVLSEAYAAECEPSVVFFQEGVSASASSPCFTSTPE